MSIKFFILMEFQQKEMVHFCKITASDSKAFAQIVLNKILDRPKCRTVFKATKYPLLEDGYWDHRNCFFDFLQRLEHINQTTDAEMPYFRLFFELTGDKVGEFEEVNHWFDTGFKDIRLSEIPKIDLQEAAADAQLIKLWQFTKDMSPYRVSTDKDDIEWMQSVESLHFLEKKYLDNRYNVSGNRPKTLRVYFLGDAPAFVLRQSALNPDFQWLARTRENNHERFISKLWLQQARAAYDALLKGYENEMEKALAQEEAARAERIRQAEAQAQKEKNALMKQARDKVKRERSESDKYRDACARAADSWFYGHASNAQRNADTWLKAQIEDELAYRYVSFKRSDG
jgi:hypothetical protein